VQLIKIIKHAASPLRLI